MTTELKKDAKIYVAGHKGLVGSAVFNLLKEKGFQNLVSAGKENLDLRRQKDVEDFFVHEKPDYIFIAAAKVGGILANNTFKAEFIHDNLAISLNLINSAFKSNVKKLVNLGSSCIYPREAPQPLHEDYLLTGKPEPTNEPYAIAKIAALKLCQFYNEQYGTDYLTLMPPNLYGINDKFNLETSHFLPSLVRKFALCVALQKRDFDFLKIDLLNHQIGFGLDNKLEISKDESIIAMLERVGISADLIKIWGTGKPRREFLAVEDLAEAILFFMENVNFKEAGELVNIGYERDYSISEVADLLREISGFQGEILFDESFPDGVLQKKLDTAKAEKLNWKPKIKFEDGLQRLYLNYINKMEKK